MSRLKPRNFEEALDQLAHSHNCLWDALDNIVTLWELEAALGRIVEGEAK